MRSVTIRRRADGVIELAPRLAPLERGDRLIVIASVLFVTAALFLGGLVPSAVTAVVAFSCVAGELVLGVKAAALALLRPRAEVRELPGFARRRAADARR